MNQNSRTKNSIRNLVVTLGCQVVTLALSFIVRTYFINILGTDYLGINGLYTNILTVLSLAELGIGSAIGFSLYKPVAYNDKDKISALMSFYKKAYLVIAGIVAVVGLALVPFLSFLVKTEREIDHLVLYYLLFLANSVVSYLFAYKSTLLYVDQRNYVVKITHTVFSLFSNAGQLIILFLTRDYIFYLVVQVLCTFLNNVVVSIVVDKNYKFIKHNKSQLSKEERKDIFTNIRAMFVYKIGGVLVNNTDNILISKIISTTAVGLYSNYTLVVNAVVNYLDMIIGSATGSIGNYNAQSEGKDSQKLFEAVSLFNYWIYGFSAVALYSLLDDFITIWLSTTNYLLDEKTLIAIVLNTFVMGISTSTATFRSTTGLFRDTKYIFAFTAVLNIIFSIILGIKIGLCGILFATSISKLLTNFWFEPYKLYNKYFGMSCKTHFLRKGLITILTIISCIIIRFIFSFLPPVDKFVFALEMVIVAIVPNVIFFLIYHKTEEFKYIVSKLKPFVEGKIKSILKK